jgi:hypothetical protein
METLFLSVLMLVLSYAIPIGNSDEDGLPSEILMGTMDPSTTQALLSTEEESSPDALKSSKFACKQNVNETNIFPVTGSKSFVGSRVRTGT